MRPRKPISTLKLKEARFSRFVTNPNYFYPKKLKSYLVRPGRFQTAEIIECVASLDNWPTRAQQVRGYLRFYSQTFVRPIGVRPWGLNRSKAISPYGGSESIWSWNELVGNVGVGHGVSPGELMDLRQAKLELARYGYPSRHLD